MSRISTVSHRLLLLEKSLNESLCEQFACPKELKDKIASYKFFEGEGVGEDKTWEPEISYLVVGISHEDAIKIGKFFEQNAIVIGKFNEIHKHSFNQSLQNYFMKYHHKLLMILSLLVENKKRN